MIYFQTKKDIEFLKKFKKDIEALYGIEKSVPESRSPIFTDSNLQKYRQKEASKNSEYLKLREEIAKNIIYATKIITKANIGLMITSYPAPAVGGPVLTANMLDVVLNDCTHGGIEHSLIIDTLNKAIGVYEKNRDEEFSNMINPFYWLKILGLFFIKLPYNILKLSGFDVSKIEQAFWGKFINLVWILLLINIFLSYGFSNKDILSFLINH